jgi:hypothetical protein
VAEQTETRPNRPVPNPAINDTTGEGLFIEMIGLIKKFELNISDIREKGYDNGSNMKGKE